MVTPLLLHVHRHTIPAALSLLPAAMTSREARAMLLAIGLQESRFQHRRQVGKGPARGFWQFERMGGVAEILTTERTKAIITPIVRMFLYPTTPTACHEAIQHHDVLAACFARLLLWVDPRPLPSHGESEMAWDIYVRNWRPGRPHIGTWAEHFEEAWSVVSDTAMPL